MAQWNWTPSCLSEMTTDQNKGRHRDPAFQSLFKYCRRISNRFPNKSLLYHVNRPPDVWIYHRIISGLRNINVFHFAVSLNNRLGLIWTSELMRSLTPQEEQALLGEAITRLNDPSSPPMS
jgi:hypothetical protein